MNVYDFDGTIYDGDSSVDFWLYSIRKKPSVFLKCLPELAETDPERKMEGTLFLIPEVSPGG